MAKKTVIKNTYGKGFTVSDGKGNKEHFFYNKDFFKEGYYGNKGTTLEKDITGGIYIKDAKSKEGELFSKGPITGDYYGDKGSIISKDVVEKKQKKEEKKKNLSDYRPSYDNNLKEDYDIEIKEYQKEKEKQLKEHLKNRGKKHSYQGSSINASELEKYKPKSNYSEQDAKNFAKYAAKLLLKNNIGIDTIVGVKDDLGIRKEITKSGPFYLISKTKKVKAEYSKDRGWGLIDHYDIDHAFSNDVDDREDHNKIVLTPHGKTLSYSYRELYYVPGYRNISYEKYNDAMREINPKECLSLINHFLVKNEIDMSMDKYLKENPDISDDIIDEYDKQIEKEKSDLLKTVVNKEGMFNSFHYTAFILFIIAFMVGPKILSGFLYVLVGFLWVALYPASSFTKDSINPDSDGIGHEIVVTLLTAFCLFVKYDANKYLFGGHYDNELSLVFLGGIIAVMVASALYKIFNKKETTIKNIDSKIVDMSKKERIIISLIICLDGLLRFFGRYILSWYDPMIYTSSFIILFIEAILVYLNKDKKIIWGLGILYLLFNFKVIRAMTFGSFHLGSFTDPGFQILYTVIINFILLSIYTILDKKN